MTPYFVILFSIFNFLFSPNSFSQQAPSLTRILFLLDGSSSMSEAWSSTTKIDAARKMISKIADSLNLSSDVQLSLRIYGHQFNSTEMNCTDTKLEVPFASHNSQGIKSALSSLRPKGITPIAYSLEQCANDFPADLRARNVIVLVTDGEESCNGDPCEVSLRLQKKHIFLRPFIIGLNLNPDETQKMECIGNYFNVQDPEALRNVMTTVISRVLSSSAVQVNLLDNQNRPLETDVNMTFYDDATGIYRYNFYETITNHGVPDTMQVDPVPKYDLIIHTTPPIEREHLNFPPHQVDTINVPASQGFLKIVLEGKTINQNLNNKIRVLVRKAGTEETIQVQNLNETQKYLSGSYDLEVLTLPRMQIKNVAITQSTTTNIQIPLPGVLSITKTYPGIGSVMLVQNNRLEKIYQLNENLSNELIGLQPGDYVILFRSKFSKKTTDTLRKKFQIKSGETTSIKL
ncbi:MAG TPA: VWA domain-containing protein [Chitinophagales bacterium]|nr:VWA domain-containing protein [Chitinophagales bacterium]